MSTTTPLGGKHTLGLAVGEYAAEMAADARYREAVKALAADRPSITLQEYVDRYKAIWAAYDPNVGAAMAANDAAQDRLEKGA